MQDEVPLFAMQGEVIREPKQVSKADAERKSRITYHRRSRTSAAAPCDDCVALAKPGAAFGHAVLRPAVYIRKQGDDERILCFEHKQERQDREWLNREKA